MRHLESLERKSFVLGDKLRKAIAHTHFFFFWIIVRTKKNQFLKLFAFIELLLVLPKCYNLFKVCGKEYATQQARMGGLSEEERKGAEKGAETGT